MKASNLSSPGAYSNSQTLRHEAAKAISYVEIAASKSASGKTSSASTLRTFFSDCVSALASLYDSTAPTVSSALVANATPTKIELTMSEALDAGVVPAVSAFVTNPVKTISSVAVAGTKVTLTVSVAFANGNVIDVDYVKPSVNALRDAAGNQVASFTNQAVTNNIA